MRTDPELSVSWAQALAWRLERQLLDPVGTGSAAEVVRRLGVVLSMDEALAELAVRTRQAEQQPDEVQEALARGELINTFTFRGAMHYGAADEVGTYLTIRAAGRQWELKSWVEHYRLTAEDWPGFRAAVREALVGREPITISELGRALARRKAFRHLRPFFDDGAGTLVKPLCWQGDLSLGPRRDGQRTVRSLEDNPHWGGIPDLEEAGPRAISAYLRSYGPATFDHVHHWLGGNLSAGRKRLDRWLADLEPSLVAVDVDGTTAYVVAEDAEALAAAEPSGSVRFVPGHDQWVMAPGTKATEVTPSAARDAVTRKGNPVLVGGVVRGTWSLRDEEVAVTWLHGPAPSAAAVAAEAGRLGWTVSR